ncbi:MAG: hydroxymethylbilane synthase [Gemmatimonadaceae bacterium]
MRTFRVGSRGSRLALTQTELVLERLGTIYPEHDFVVERIATKGDVLSDTPLAAIGRGVFVDAIEEALRERRIDFAVHSAKDLPSQLNSDLQLGAVLERADPRDALVSHGAGLTDLPTGARVGTSSARRACQIHARRPDLELVPVRGNVETRLRKLDAGDFDAIVLAVAGLARLALESRVTEYFEPVDMVPCPGQGALAVEIRAEDADTARLLAPLGHATTTVAVRAERGFLARLGAGCAAPVGAYARYAREQTLVLDAFVGAIDGRMVRGTQSGSSVRPEVVGVALAEELLAGGGEALLREATQLARPARA